MRSNQTSQAARGRHLGILLRCGASALALGFAANGAAAWAQDTQPGPVQATQPGSTSVDQANSPNTAPATAPGQNAPSSSATGISDSTSTAAKNPPDTTAVTGIVVTGVRASLATSQVIKRNSDTVVDSITATDINAFPDKSVAEALQRVAGITVSRFAATTDTTHFSAEPSSVIVRGLQQVRSEFNGRDSFNANSGRGLSFGDVSPELMAGVDAYKNLTAEMIEGGIAGTINLRTRLPFDSNGQLLAFSADALWGDLARKLTPDASVLYSNRWNTEYGDFGLLADLAYSDVETDQQGIVYGRIGPYVGFTAPATATTPDYGKQTVWIPSGIEDHDVLYDRKRTGIALAGQWRSPDHKWLLTAQYNDSDYQNVWHEHAIGSYPGYSFYGNSVNYQCTPTDSACGGASMAPYPAPGTAPFTFDNNGMFASGVMTTALGWWGSGNAEAGNFAKNALGQNMVNACYNNNDNGWGATPACTPPQRGPDFGVTTRYSDTKENTGDGSINLKYDPSDNLHFNFDFQHIHSTVQSYDATVQTYSYANVELIGNGNSAPQMTLLPGTNINYGPGGLQDASNYYFRSAQDHLENSEGDENAFRADGEYDFNTTWLNALKFGYRYADRDQTVRWTTYNWGSIANNWTEFAADGTTPQSVYWNTTNTTPSGPFKGYPAGMMTTWSLPASFFNGNNINMTTFPGVNWSYMTNRAALAKALGLPSIGVGSWDPLCSNTGTRANELPGQCYTLAEIDSLDEQSHSGYVMLKFGGGDAKLFGFPVSGNIGVRFVHTEDVSTGGINLPTLTTAAYPCTATDPYYNGGPGAPSTGPSVPHTPYSVGCYLYGGSASQQVYDYTYDPTTKTYSYVANGTRQIPTGLPGQPQEVGFNNGATQPSTVHNPSDFWLPSFNVKFQLTDTWLMRFAYSRAMSRPDIGLLKNYTGVGFSMPGTSNPVICSNTATTQQVGCFTSTNGQISGINGVQPFYSASAFNPSLKPITADQFDLSFENYFAKVGQFSLDFFFKNFNNYIQYGSYYLPVTEGGATRTVLVRGPVNTTGAHLEGAEVAFQRFFDFLPGIWNGLGVQANFTYVHNSGLQNSNVAVVGPAGQGSAVTNAGVPDQLNTGTLEALSKYSYNIIGMYEKGPVAIRLAYNWRSEFLVTALDCCTYLPMWQEAQGFLDGSFRYRIGEHTELDFEATNLLNTRTVLEQQVTDVSNGRKLIPSSWFQSDRRFQMGVRFKF